MSESTSVCSNCPSLCRARCARRFPLASRVFRHLLTSLSLSLSAQCSMPRSSFLPPIDSEWTSALCSVPFSFSTPGRREILCPHSASSSARPSAWHTSAWHRWRCRLIHWGESLSSDKLLEALQSLQNALAHVCSGDSTKIDKMNQT